MSKVMVNLGWDAKFIVPASKLSALLGILDECERVDTAYVNDETHIYKKVGRIEMEVVTRPVLDARPEHVEIVEETADGG